MACQPKLPVVESTQTPAAQTETGTPEETASVTPVPTLGVAESSLRGVEIRFLHPWSGATSDSLDQLVGEFNRTNTWGVKVNLTAAGSAGMVIETLSTRSVKDKAWDVVVAPVSILLGVDQSNGDILDLNPYTRSSQFGMSEMEQQDYLADFWAENLVGGKLYGIPAQQSAAVLFYNATWARQLGFSNPPATPDDFNEQVCNANASMKLDNDRANDSLGGWIIDTDAYTGLSWMRLFEGIDPRIEIDTFQKSGVENTLTYLHNLVTNSCAWPSRLPEPYDYFARRQSLIYSGSLQDILPQQAAMERAANQDEWQVIAYPGEGQPAWLAEGSSFGILETTPERQLASWLFVRWISEPEQQARLLASSGTLPLGEQVMAGMADFAAAHPQWAAMAENVPAVLPMTPSANLQIQLMVIEDAGKQLFSSEFKSDQIQALTAEMDALLEELIERQP